jgi:hypothetical protein
VLSVIQNICSFYMTQQPQVQLEAANHEIKYLIVMKLNKIGDGNE